MPFRAKRRYPRARISRAALVRRLTTDPLQEPFEDFAQARVLGAGGCMIESRKPLGYGSLAQVLIAVGGDVVQADSRVVWEKARPAGGHEVGVEFVRISRDDRDLIESLVARHRTSAPSVRHGP